jgi:transcriptional regulator with XRE-family HTH domain
MSTTFNLGLTLRTGRRRADFSQRELARAAGVAASTVARLEAQPLANPRLSVVRSLLHAMDLRLAGLDTQSGTELVVPTAESWRDKAGRHYPPHLEPIPTVGRDDYLWWGWLAYSTWSVPPCPEYTYFLNREVRDAVRRHMDPWREWVNRGPLRRDGPSRSP